MAPQRFVLLDRDGTINVEREYLSDPEELELISGAAEGLRALQQLGLGLVVVTNQSGIGRGYFDTARVDEIHRHLCRLLAAEGVTLTGIYVCPHRPEEGCNCRKPRPGLALRAADELGFVPQECFVIGDKDCDVDLGKSVGATSLLVRTGYGTLCEQARRSLPDFVVADLAEAADVIRTRLEGPRNAQ